jgi:hypothetical protein
MRTSLSALAVIFAAQAIGQTSPSEMPVGIFRGTLLLWTGTAGAGDLTVRRADSAVFLCHYDSHSLVEADNRPVGIAGLTTGDPLKILTDHKPGSPVCYARTVEVVNPEVKPLRARAVPVAKNTPDFLPRGDRTLAGLILRHDSGLLTIRTRGGDLILALRPNTRFLADGVSTNAQALTVNTHVSVRAGKDLYGNMEAYQVMWGEILNVP